MFYCFFESPNFFETIQEILRKGSIENYIHMQPVKQSPFFQEEKFELYSIISNLGCCNFRFFKFHFPINQKQKN